MRDFYEVILYIREFNSGITICTEILRETNKFHELPHQATFGVSLTVGVHFPRYPVKVHSRKDTYYRKLRSSLHENDRSR